MIKILSFILGLVYYNIVGFPNIPVFAQEAVFNLLFLFITIYLLTNKGIKLIKGEYLLLAFGVLISIYFAITTNPLLVIVNYVSLTFLASLFLIALHTNNNLPKTGTEYLKGLYSYLRKSIISAISISTFISLISFKTSVFKTQKVNRGYLKGIIVALPLLAAFHILFSQINTDYKLFMDDILSYLWEIIKYIFNIDIIWTIGKILLLSHIFYSLLSSQKGIQEDVSLKENSPKEVLKTVLGLVILLFLIFSAFQSKLIFLDFSKLAFIELSIYTQQGFWQLILVSVLGYFLVLAAIKQMHNAISVRNLVQVFLCELVLICIFTYHKLFQLQIHFGFKDQRLLATAATTLIFTTFVLLLFRCWQKISSSQIFQFQMYAFIATVAFLNILNIDLFVTKVNPISYYVGDTKYKDYSYMLTNSYDNYTEWTNLMEEVKTVGFHNPENYYWGRYHSLCSFSVNSLSNKNQLNTEKYGKFPTKNILSNQLKFNLREYNASKLLVENEADFKTFYKFIETECKKPENSKNTYSPTPSSILPI